MTKVNCVALDLDDCLAYFKDNREGFWQIFRDLGYSDEEIKIAYEVGQKASRHIGETMVSELSHIRPANIQTSDIVEKINNWTRSNITLFPETLEVIEKLKAKLPVVIVTHGFAEIQQLKIDSTQLVGTEAILVPVGHSKTEAIKTLLNRFGAPILFVDDRPKVFQTLLDEGINPSEVLMFRIEQPKSYYKFDTDSPIPKIVSLDEVLSYIEV